MDPQAASAKVARKDQRVHRPMEQDDPDDDSEAELEGGREQVHWIDRQQHDGGGGQGVEAFRVEVADSQQGELVRIGHDAFEDVRAADAAANHGDGFGRAHDRHSELRSAMSCAVRASYKQDFRI